MRQRELLKFFSKLTCEQVLSLGFKPTLSGFKVHAHNLEGQCDSHSCTSLRSPFSSKEFHNCRLQWFQDRQILTQDQTALPGQFLQWPHDEGAPGGLLLPKAGLLYKAVFALELPVRLKETVRSIPWPESLPAKSYFLSLPAFTDVIPNKHLALLTPSQHLLLRGNIWSSQANIWLRSH